MTTNAANVSGSTFIEDKITIIYSQQEYPDLNNLRKRIWK